MCKQELETTGEQIEKDIPSYFLEAKPGNTICCLRLLDISSNSNLPFVLCKLDWIQQLGGTAKKKDNHVKFSCFLH